MPKKLSFTILLFITATIFAQDREKWDYFINKYPVEKIYLHADRTFYKPGEQIWFKVYVTDATLNRKEALSEIAIVELVNPRGGVDKTFSIYVKEGIGAGSYWLPQNVPGGQYKLRAYTAWMRNFDEKECYSKDLFVQKAQMPLLLMNLDFERKAYGAGDEIQANLEVKTQQNIPLVNYPLTYTVNIEGNRILTAKARTGQNGKAALKAILPQTILSADGILNVMINYEGSTEAISRSIPLVMNNLNVRFFPEGGYLVENVEGNLAFKATNEFGKPADVEGEIRDSSGVLITRFHSKWMGLGSVGFTPEPGKKYHAVITSPPGITHHYEILEVLPSAYSIRVFAVNKNMLNVTVHSPNEEPYFITVTSGETLISQDFKGEGNVQQYLIDVSHLPAGIARVTLLNRHNVEQCERLIYIGDRAPMNIKITPDKTGYLPGEEVKLNIETYDANNKPLQANLSLSVIDDKIHAFADDRQDNILSWLLMSSELKDKVEDASYYFNPDKEKAMQSIDYVLLTHGWRRFTWNEINNPDIEIKSLPASFSYIGGTVRAKGAKNGVVADVWLVSYGRKKTVSHLRTSNSGKFLFTNVDRSGKLQLIANPLYYSRDMIQIDTLSLDLRALQKGLSDEQAIKRAQVRNDIILEGEKVEEEKKENDRKIYYDNNQLLELPELQEVVITDGKPDRTGSISQISISEPVATVATSVEQALRATGVQVAQSAGHPGEAAQATIRGISSVYGSRADGGTPLYVIDGIPVQQGTSNPLASIDDLAHIVSIEVQKDAFATSIFGARAANGVIFITTQRSTSLPAYKTLGKPTKNEPSYVSVIIPPVKATPAIRQTYNPRNYIKKTRDARYDFRSTLYWNPNINTDTLGKASVKLYNSDAVGGFRVIAEGIGESKPGHGEITYFTSLPFSLTAKLPSYLCFGDTLLLPVILKNQTDKLLQGTLINGGSRYRNNHDFQLANNYAKEKEVEMEPYSTTTIYVPYQVNNIPGNSYLTTSFKGKGVEDHIEQRIELLPKDFPAQATFASSDTATYRFVVNKPVEGSQRGEFVMNLDVLQQLILGGNSIIREPNGCFEQTTSKLFIDAAALNYLLKSEKKEPETEALLRKYIKTGYSKMLSYEDKKGGFGWFGNGTNNIALTAKCLMHLVEMKNFGIEGLDGEIITRTKTYLLNRLDGKGNFVQEKPYYQYAAPTNAISNAYTVYALSEAGINEIKMEYITAVNEAFNSKDIYRLALLANAAYNYKDYNTAGKLLAELNAIVDKKGYKRTGNSNTITYSWGYSYNTEVNALHLSALLKSRSLDEARIKKAYSGLMKGRSYYGFGSTQATLLALNAMIDYNLLYPVVIETNAILKLTINDTSIVQKISPEKDVIRIDYLQKQLQEGENRVKVSYAGVKNTSYGLNFNWTSITPSSSSKCMVNLTTTIDNQTKKVGETARLTAIVENKTNSPLPMTVALIGIPSGASPQYWQLKEIQEKAQADFVEIDKNYVVLYFEGLNPKEKRRINLDLRMEIPGSFQAPASSAYLYYTDEYKVWNDGVGLKIVPE